MPDVGFGTYGSGTRNTSDSPLYSDGIGLPTGRVCSDGANRAAITALLANADRYNSTAPTADADPGAEPVWGAVGTGGSHEWHDHRMHWMAESVPAPGEPGDLVSRAIEADVGSQLVADLRSDGLGRLVGLLAPVAEAAREPLSEHAVERAGHGVVRLRGRALATARVVLWS